MSPTTDPKINCKTFIYELRKVLNRLPFDPQTFREGGIDPFLLAEPRQYWSLQGRGGNVFTNHRLKSRWTLSARNVWLTRENLQQCLYTDVEIEYVADGRIEKVSGEMATLPDFGHTYEEPQTSTVDSWRFFNLSNPRSYRLRTQPLFPTTVPDPVVTQDDMRLVVEVEYEKPVPLDEVETTTTDTITLYTPWQPNDAQAYMGECSFDDPNGVSIRTQFYVQWQLPGILAPTSVQLDQTRIEGLTTEPIVLTGYFSQSVGAGAHLLQPI